MRREDLKVEVSRRGGLALLYPAQVLTRDLTIEYVCLYIVKITRLRCFGLVGRSCALFASYGNPPLHYHGDPLLQVRS